MDTGIPALTTIETQRLRSDYPSIEHLEAGNVAAWLVERQEQLLVRAKDERTGMNLAKLLTLAGGAVGAVCYATSPLAPVGALVAGVGYVWAVAQDINASHQFAPIPFVRGNFIEFLSAMGDSEAREDWFANSNELVDLMFHLDPFERYEFGMLKEHAHVLSEYLIRIEPGKRFYAYRWLFDWFVNLRGSFPGIDQLTSHLATVTADPRVNYQQVQAIQEHQARVESPPAGIPPAKIGNLPEISVAELPSSMGANTQLEAIETTASVVTSDKTQGDEKSVREVQPQELASPQPTTPIAKGPSTPVDIAIEMASVPKSTIIAASPRVGKGVVVSMAIAHLKQLHPDLEIWLIDPKDEPTERHYWSGIDPDKRCHFDLRDFDVDVEGAIEAFSDLLTRFNRSPKHRKLLIIDEFVTLNQKCAGPFMNQLKDFVVGICSSGEVNPDMGIGRFVWAITQSPYVSDLGFKTKAALSSFQRVFLLSKASISLYQLAVSASFVPDGFEQRIIRLLEPTGRIFYYSRTDSWHPIPIYNLSNSSKDNLVREKGKELLPLTSQLPVSPPEVLSGAGRTSGETEGPEVLPEVELPGSDWWRKYFPSAPEAIEEVLYTSYQSYGAVEGGKGKFIAEILKCGSGGRKYQAASAYVDYLCKKFGK
ncbi:hypothetical protein NDI39_29700 [Microcoleus sp. ZQ-A2]|nr:hypothetical protein [Microcoleus sp. FACHB-1]